MMKIVGVGDAKFFEIVWVVKFRIILAGMILLALWHYSVWFQNLRWEWVAVLSFVMLIVIPISSLAMQGAWLNRD